MDKIKIQNKKEYRQLPTVGRAPLDHRLSAGTFADASVDGRPASGIALARHSAHVTCARELDVTVPEPWKQT